VGNPDAHTCEHIVNRYVETYGKQPACLAYAPGRIELIGNHTDYNGGLVLSATTTTGVYFAGCLDPGTHQARLMADDLHETTCYPMDDFNPSGTAHWSDYTRGVSAVLASIQALTPGYSAVIGGSLPMGSGLASSAAVAMASAEGLKKLYGIPLEPTETAYLAQRAEQSFTGVPCGLLDQLSISLGKKNHLLLIDFKAMDHKYVALPEKVEVMVCVTHKRHRLRDGLYDNTSRVCKKAEQHLIAEFGTSVQSISDVTLEQLMSVKKTMPDTPFNHARHVLEENERVKSCVNALHHGDAATAGRLMTQSHHSSVTLLNNSSEEQDWTVAYLQAQSGILGARLSGGGYGGSVVSLVHSQRAQHLADELSTAYQKHFREDCRIMIMRPAGACGLVDLPFH
jgi:galactokinase